MSGQYRRWCFTLNNPEIVLDYYKIISDHGDVRRFVYGIEVGDQGTRHLQGYIEFTKPKRLTPLKIMFPTAHWEAAKGNYKQNHKYCTKEKNSVEFGDWTGTNEEISRKANKKELIKSILDGDRTAMCSNAYISHKRSIDSIVGVFRYENEKRRRREALEDALLTPWQKDIFITLQNQGNRKVTWVYDEQGGKGKSWFAAYLRDVYQFEHLDGVTKASDVVQLLSDKIRGIVFDVTRNDASHFSYQTLERAKDGYMITGKYEGIKRIFDIVPVIVFANFAPLETSLSADRWDIHSLNDGIQETSCQKIYDPKKDYPPPERTKDALQEKDDE